MIILINQELQIFTIKGETRVEECIKFNSTINMKTVHILFN